MSSWEPHILTTAGKKSLGIVEALEADIYAGILKPGDRLPAQRLIADKLNVDLTTVTRAFNEARRRGLVEGNAGRGSFVRHGVEKKLLADKLATLDLSMNNPPQPCSVNLQQLISEGIAGVISDQRRMLQLQYQECIGNPEDRDAAAFWLRHKVQDLSAERVIISSGAQTALFAICKHLLAVGDGVATAHYTYPGLKAVAEQQSFHLFAVASDEAGMLPSALAECCQQNTIRALYLIPALDNPTTISMPLDRRLALIEVAKRYGLAIIEDDPYSPLQSQTIASFAELLPEKTWHIATLSKCATPALRVAFVIVPDMSSLQALSTIIRATLLMAPPLMTALVTRWIYDGTLQNIASEIRRENNKRQSLAATILSEFSFVADQDGHHIWLTLPDNWQANDFAMAAERLGVNIVPGQRFAVEKTTEETVRVSLGLAVDHQALAEALGILKSLLSQMLPASRAVV